MKSVLFALAAVLSLAPGLSAQDSSEPKRFERRAERMVAGDPASPGLTPAEERVVVSAIAAKLREINRYNWSHLLTGRKKMTGANVGVAVSDTDLDGLYEKFPKLDKKKVVSQGEEQGEPGKPYEVPLPPEMTLHEVHGDPFHGLFADNEWEVLKDSTDALDLVDQIDEALKTAGPNGFIAGVEIKSSASTLPNTGKAANMSFLQLSQARANEALKFILAKLLDKGVVLDQSQVHIIAAGDNGEWPRVEGTSGPPAPGDPYWKRNNKNAPAKDEYDQYKYVDVTIQAKAPELVQRTKTVVPEGDWSSRAVTLDMSVKSKRWRFWNKVKKLLVHHKHAKRRHPPGAKKQKAIPCPHGQAAQRKAGN